jgi:hypothetical protein
MKPNYHYITNPVFLVSLFVLIFNDFYLKETYHNWATGKLSDIAGVIVFAFFLTAFRSDLKKHLFIITAFLFAFWKSEASQILIDSWNAMSLVTIQRTVDYTDIFCLLIFIPLYGYRPRPIIPKINTKKLIIYPTVAATLFAIVATSMAKHLPVNTISIHEFYKVRTSQETFLKSLENNQIKYTVTDSILIANEDTLNKIILEDFILNQDTISEASIGILDKGKRIKVYAETLQFSEFNSHLIYIRQYKKERKKYSKAMKEFVQGFE